MDIDDSYDKIYLGLSRRGARVLALGWKEIGRMSHQQAKDVTRESLESELHFGGFIAISCPLKPDSKSVVKELLNSTHMVISYNRTNFLLSSYVIQVSRWVLRFLGGKVTVYQHIFCKIPSES